MNSTDIRQKFLDFFKDKGHAVLPSSPIVPENDPTTLFTTAGMQPLVPYLLGEKHPAGKRLVNSQKCIRTGDIDEVGDETHLTFFEMLGNWSLGDPDAKDGIGAGYWKEDAIKWSFEFLTGADGLGTNKDLLAVSVFAGDPDVPKDEESAEIWKSLGIPDSRVAYLGREDNWWGPAGETGPCGPDTEMFVWSGEGEAPEKFDPKDPLWVEVWNDVFMEYNRTKDGKYEKLKQKNVDTGMGLERVTAVIQRNATENKPKDIFETDLFLPIIRAIEIKASDKYEFDKKSFRIIADHLKAAVFIISDGVMPSNLDRGYVVRRLIRRAVRRGRNLGIEKDFTRNVAEAVYEIYGEHYEELTKEKENVLREIAAEEARFIKTLERGEREIEKILKKDQKITGTEAFTLYDTYGYPVELTKEIMKEKNVEAPEDFETKFNQKMEEQKMRSRTATEGQFKGGLADHSEITTWYHSVTHLMYRGLRNVLGEHVHQRGSNITPERTRFDFSHSEKVTPEQLKQVEDYVNSAIKAGLDVSYEELPTDSAFEKGALGEFGHKYGDVVKVYTFREPDTGKVWSYEICGGPHVGNTSEIKGTFKIIKEESSSAGVRRIKAIIERQDAI